MSYLYWDCKSINRCLKGLTLEVNSEELKGSITIKYISVKCGNAVDIILSDDFCWRQWRGQDFIPINKIPSYVSTIRVNRDIRWYLARTLAREFKLYGFGFVYWNYRAMDNFKIRKIVRPKKSVRP